MNHEDVWQEPSAAVEVHGVTKAFADNRVLKGIDLSIRPGEVLGLIGQNGVGKSTLAAVLAGRQQADGGEMLLFGRPWDPARVGIIEQQLDLDQEQRVVDALFRNAPDDSPVEERREAARRVLIEAGIAVDPDDRLGDLSDAEQRMVELVRLLADPRDFVLIDEVSTTFNAREVEDLRHLIRRANEAGTTIVYITHRHGEVIDLCNRIAVLRDGRVSQVVSTLTATEESLSEAVFDRVVELQPHRAHSTGRVALSVRGLQLGSDPVSFDVLSGEVLGLSGARGAGITELLASLTGEAPLEVESVRLEGTEVKIRSHRDASRLRIAVVSGGIDESAESYFARNLMMLNHGHASEDAFDAEYEETTKILFALREAETAASRLFNRPPQSVGQRRWQQLREVAAEHARLLVLIEPTQALDLEAREHFLALLDDVTARGAAVLLATSDEAELKLLSDRILVFSDHALKAEWEVGEVDVEHLRSVSRGEWPPESLPSIDAVLIAD